MEKLSQSLVSKLSTFQKRLESFLENDFESHIEEAHRKDAGPFEASRDLSVVRGLSLGLPEDHIDRAVVVFSRLALLFDAGVMLENNDGVWKAQAYFSEGVTRVLKNSEKNVVKIPVTSLMTVLQTSPQPLLAKLNLAGLDPAEKTNCLLIRVTADFAFLLFSSLPDLWLKEHIENVRTALINGFAD
jgi:hypothetical protein